MNERSLTLVSTPETAPGHAAAEHLDRDDGHDADDETERGQRRADAVCEQDAERFLDVLDHAGAALIAYTTCAAPRSDPSCPRGRAGYVPKTQPTSIEKPTATEMISEIRNRRGTDETLDRAVRGERHHEAEQRADPAADQREQDRLQ